jgi:hypothetical protein
MRELSQLLSALKIDDRPLTCEHAVLISESRSELLQNWAISILGVRLGDYERLSAARSFSAIGSQGEHDSGEVRAASGAMPGTFTCKAAGHCAPCAKSERTARPPAQARPNALRPCTRKGPLLSISKAAEGQGTILPASELAPGPAVQHDTTDLDSAS